MRHHRSTNQIDTFFPDDGPVRRDLYQKHLQFFRAGQTERERAFIAANRIGKTTTAGGYETATHLMGLYPDWWEGRRWDRPIRAWVAGDTGETVREIIQPILFGPPGQLGTGLIRAHTIEKITNRRGSPEAIESAYIRHSSGQLSTLLFKSYEQGRKTFQGTKRDLIWCDEEPSMSIYAECLLRLTATTPGGDDWGSMLCTFTPLEGLSEVVLHFLGENMGQDVETMAQHMDRMSRETPQEPVGERLAEPARDLMGKPKVIGTTLGGH